jgi:electron transfer flavoprotein beta subunit
VKIVVLLKQTPDTETQIVLATDAKSIDHSQSKYIINPYDEFAIEEALRIQEKTPNTEVVLLCFGPASAKERIIKGLAMGPDRGLLIDNTGWEHSDSLVTAKILATAIQKESCDLVLCGKQSIDDDNMSVGVMLAEFLHWPHVNVVTKVTMNGAQLSVDREVEGGQTEVYETRLPVVLGAHKSLNTPRYTSLPGIMKAKKKPLDVKTLQDLGLDTSTLQSLQLTKIEGFSYPPEKPKGKIFKDESVEIMVDKLVKALREEVKVI